MSDEPSNVGRGDAPPRFRPTSSSTTWPATA